MAVYVDDYRVPAKAGQHESRWSHLWADSQEELHAFATRLGLRRSWFQPGKSRGGQPSSTCTTTSPTPDGTRPFGSALGRCHGVIPPQS